ncbi:MAG: VOC family protein [Betaproteobacteria bacterium]|nr:MAG: VOC family protein [Betaproteobacteria bacterium]
MASAEIRFDHVHLVARDPVKTAQWYVDTLGGQIWKSVEVRGAPQVYVAFGDALVIVRGQRGAEVVQDKGGLEWGIDHFGVRVNGDFDAFCEALKRRGVTFSMEPTDFNPTTRIAFIDAPDGVSIELLNRK